MSSFSNPTGARPDAWSALIARRYHLSLSPELVRWFDDEVWRECGFGEYREPLPPDALLHTAPEAIWPGLMPPDFLPVIGNCAGDWLCFRLGDGGRVAEIVQWYHGGGDWLPWGRSLAEAILFDAVHGRLPGSARRHAVPAEPVRLEGDRATTDPLLIWALHQLPAEAAALPTASDLDPLDGPAPEGSEAFVREMLRLGLAEVALRSELTQRTLADARLELLDNDPDTARRLGICRGKLNEWLFDLARVPDPQRVELLQPIGVDTEAMDRVQDWRLVAEHCRRVTELAPHLAWAWDLLGYAHARSGAYTDAARCYAEGLWRSVFTDQSIRFRTHWVSKRAAKFSAAMLRELVDDGRVDIARAGVEIDVGYFEALCDPSPERQSRVTAYWLARAERSLASGDGQAAYQETLAAGWDLGAASLAAYGSVLDRLVIAAEASGDPARAELARTHRRCLSDRLGV